MSPYMFSCIEYILWISNVETFLCVYNMSLEVNPVDKLIKNAKKFFVWAEDLNNTLL